MDSYLAGPTGSSLTPHPAVWLAHALTRWPAGRRERLLAALLATRARPDGLVILDLDTIWQLLRQIHSRPAGLVVLLRRLDVVLLPAFPPSRTSWGGVVLQVSQPT